MEGFGAGVMKGQDAGANGGVSAAVPGQLVVMPGGRHPTGEVEGRVGLAGRDEDRKCD